MFSVKFNNIFKILEKIQKYLKMNTHSNSKIVAVCQMTSTDDKEKNFLTCENLVKSAKEHNASVSYFIIFYSNTVLLLFNCIYRWYSYRKLVIISVKILLIQ